MNPMSPLRPTEDRLVVKVIEAVAEERGIDPVDMDEKLNEVLDPEAMEHLFRDRPNGSPRAGGTLIFDLAGYQVRIDGDLSVDVNEEINA